MGGCCGKSLLEIYSESETKENNEQQTNTKNPTTGELFTKYRVQVTKGNKQITIGGYEVSEQDALHQFNFTSDTYFDYDLDKECICREENVLYIDTLCELMMKLVNIHWDVDVLKLIAEEAGVNSSSPAVDWFGRLMEEDGMVDTFRHFYPSTQGR